MIELNAFASEPADLHRAELDAIAAVLSSGWYILGPSVTTFEVQWAARLNAKHCVGVGNGMDAIEIAIRALGIRRGDEIITTPMTAFATVLAILRAGATPVLADISPATGLLDVESAERCVSRNTRAVIPVHLYGRACDMTQWLDFCSTHSIFLIEDCAQAHDAKWGGESVGTFGNAGAFSFYPTKNLGAPGDGGAIVTNNSDLDHAARMLRNYGQSERYKHPVVGMNSRLDEIQAAVLSVRLERLTAFTERRREIASEYMARLCNPAVRLMAAPIVAESHVHHLFVVTCNERNRLANHLRSAGVQTLSHYPIPIHLQDPCMGVARDPHGLANAECHAANCLSLPCHPQMSEEDITSVVNAVMSFR
jgi:dTDP-4-amino-4,6-dideoxygalactose transaminase